MLLIWGLLPIFCRILPTEGFLLDTSESAFICTIGSSLQFRLSEALEKCTDYWVSKYEMKGKRIKGRNSRMVCQKFADLLSEVQQESAVSFCVFNELGWINLNTDNGFSMKEDVIYNEDLATVMDGANNNINQKQIEMCSRNLFKKKERDLKKCKRPKYNKRQLAQVMREYEVKYTYDCIMDAIAMSCNIEMNYLLQQGKTAAKELSSKTPEELNAMLNQYIPSIIKTIEFYSTEFVEGHPEIITYIEQIISPNDNLVRGTSPSIESFLQAMASNEVLVKSVSSDSYFFKSLTSNPFVKSMCYE